MAMLLRTLNPEVADELDPESSRRRRRPFEGQMVLFHYREGQSLDRRVTVPAIVTKVMHGYDGYTLNLVTLLPVKESITWQATPSVSGKGPNSPPTVQTVTRFPDFNDVPCRSDQNRSGWSFIDMPSSSRTPHEGQIVIYHLDHGERSATGRLTAPAIVLRVEADDRVELTVIFAGNRLVTMQGVPRRAGPDHWSSWTFTDADEKRIASMEGEDGHHHHAA
jgi:hypothetical protein